MAEFIRIEVMVPTLALRRYAASMHRDMLADERAGGPAAVPTAQIERELLEGWAGEIAQEAEGCCRQGASATWRVDREGEPPKRTDAVQWPVLACLEDCGHFKAFAVEDSPHMGQVVHCAECETIRKVLAAVSVADLARLVEGAPAERVSGVRYVIEQRPNGKWYATKHIPESESAVCGSGLQPSPEDALRWAR